MEWCQNPYSDCKQTDSITIIFYRCGYRKRFLDDHQEYQTIKKCFYSPSYMLTRAEVTRRLDVRFRIICQIKLISESWYILFGKIKEINERSLNVKHLFLTRYPTERKSSLFFIMLQHRARKYQSYHC